MSDRVNTYDQSLNTGNGLLSHSDPTSATSALPGPVSTSIATAEAGSLTQSSHAGSSTAHPKETGDIKPPKTDANSESSMTTAETNSRTSHNLTPEQSIPTTETADSSKETLTSSSLTDTADQASTTQPSTTETATSSSLVSTTNPSGSVALTTTTGTSLLPESFTESSQVSSSSAIPPVPPPVPLFTKSTTSDLSEITSSSTDFGSTLNDSASTTSWQETTSAPGGRPSNIDVANIQLDSSASFEYSRTEEQTSIGSSTSTNNLASAPITANNAKASADTTSIVPGQSAASSEASSSANANADSAHSSSDPNIKSEEQGGKLGSIAIVGIVGGVLVGLILLYLAWYQWRKKRAREALNDLSDDPMDEKFSPKLYHSRVTRSSFGAADPITPYPHRHKGRRRESLGNDDEDDEHWFEPHQGYSADPEDRSMGQDPFDDALFNSSRNTLPTNVGRTEYMLGQYGDGMTAALAEDLSPTLPHTAIPSRTRGENPFVPPVPQMPPTYGGLNRNATNRTVRTIPAVPDDVDPGYDESVYQTYGGSSRPQTEYMEPSTSNLLPWINKGHQDERFPNQPELGQVPVDTDSEERGNQRAPPRAMMAQVPVGGRPEGHGGELGQIPIPAFR
ncbi:uncharacterized protein IL334_006759 [Kwoniella shivajii]|uniref:Uncharacterized protein n=1 Tax=Kwoniella shivajii TaxID=564305 RepID=A0ABZ1D767_9TREE|nr:hypothetical protein IL334_006759 [Kwoniella shivajii]